MILTRPGTPTESWRARRPSDPESAEVAAPSLGRVGTVSTQDETGQRIVKVAISLVVALADRLPGRSLADRARGVMVVYHEVPESEQARFAYQLELIRAAGVPVGRAGLTGAPDGRWRIGICFDDALQSFEAVARPELDRRAMPSTVYVITDRLRDDESCTEPTHEGQAVMTRAAVGRLPELGHEIGSHTVSHPRLSSLPDDVVLAELVESRRYLEGLAGRSVTSLAFPFGDWNRRTVELAIEAGYDQVCSVNPDLVGPGDDLVLGRIVASPSDWPIETWLKVRGCYRWVARWSHFKGRLTGTR